MLPKEITTAINKANELVDQLLNANSVEDQRTELGKLTKKELIEKVIELTNGKKNGPSIEQLAYAILEEPDCAWLTWDMVASIIRNRVPNAETSAQGIRWYSSKGIEKKRNVVQRVKATRIAQLLAEAIQ